MGRPTGVVGVRRRVAAGFVVSAALLAAFVWAFGPEAVVADIVAADTGPFVAGLAAVLVAVVLWSEAQRHLLAAADIHLGPWRTFVTYCTGMFAKQVLPAGHAGGPAIMVYTLGAETRRDYQHLTAAVSVAEVLNLVASFGLAAAGLVYLAATVPASPELRTIQLGVVFAVAVLGGLVAVLLYRRSTVERAVAGVAFLLRSTVGRGSARVRRRTDRAAVRAGVDSYYATFAKVRGDRRRVALAAGLSLVGRLLFALPLYTAFLALGHSVPVALALFVVPIGGLATTVPLPGGLGGVEAVLAAVLVATTGFALAELGAVVILYRLASYWFMVLVGGLGSAYRALVGAPVPLDA